MYCILHIAYFMALPVTYDFSSSGLLHTIKLMETSLQNKLELPIGSQTLVIKSIPPTTDKIGGTFDLMV